MDDKKTKRIFLVTSLTTTWMGRKAPPTVSQPFTPRSVPPKARPRPAKPSTPAIKKPVLIDKLAVGKLTPISAQVKREEPAPAPIIRKPINSTKEDFKVPLSAVVSCPRVKILPKLPVKRHVPFAPPVSTKPLDITRAQSQPLSVKSTIKCPEKKAPVVAKGAITESRPAALALPTPETSSKSSTRQPLPLKSPRLPTVASRIARDTLPLTPPSSKSSTRKPLQLKSPRLPTVVSRIARDTLPLTPTSSKSSTRQPLPLRSPRLQNVVSRVARDALPLTRTLSKPIRCPVTLSRYAALPKTKTPVPLGNARAGVKAAEVTDEQDKKDRKAPAARRLLPICGDTKEHQDGTENEVQHSRKAAFPTRFECIRPIASPTASSRRSAETNDRASSKAGPKGILKGGSAAGTSAGFELDEESDLDWILGHTKVGNEARRSLSETALRGEEERRGFRMNLEEDLALLANIRSSLENMSMHRSTNKYQISPIKSTLLEPKDSSKIYPATPLTIQSCSTPTRSSCVASDTSTRVSTPRHINISSSSNKNPKAIFQKENAAGRIVGFNPGDDGSDLDWILGYGKDCNETRQSASENVCASEGERKEISKRLEEDLAFLWNIRRSVENLPMRRTTKELQVSPAKSAVSGPRDSLKIWLGAPLATKTSVSTPTRSLRVASDTSRGTTPKHGDIFQGRGPAGDHAKDSKTMRNENKTVVDELRGALEVRAVHTNSTLSSLVAKQSDVDSYRDRSSQLTDLTNQSGSDLPSSGSSVFGLSSTYSGTSNSSFVVNTTFGSRRVRKFVIPPLDENSLPSRDAAIQMEVATLRVQKRVAAVEASGGLPEMVKEGRSLSLRAMGIVQKVKANMV